MKPVSPSLADMLALSATFSDQDAHHMRRALEAARPRQGHTWPNPGVGCVVVDARGEVRGVAATAIGGRPHAEPQALAQAGALARGATVYVTLEPCSHHGKSPPCASALIGADVARVVVATTDPDPRVSGRGIAMLRAAGIDCAVGLLDAEADALHRPFFHRIRTGRPWIELGPAPVSPSLCPPDAILTAGGHGRSTSDLPDAADGTGPYPLRVDIGLEAPHALRHLVESWGHAGLTHVQIAPEHPLANALLEASLVDDVQGTPGFLAGAHLVLATHNPGKMAELRQLLGPALGSLRSAETLGLQAPPETGATYVENALLKARATAAACEPRVAGGGAHERGTWVLADDGGIEVEVLDGAPGVRTADFATDQGGWSHARRELARRTGLLELARDAAHPPTGGPRARIHCALALINPEGEEATVHAAVDGQLRWPPRAEGPGFAPIFSPSGGRAMADAHGVLIHRRLAFSKLLSR